MAFTSYVSFKGNSQGQLKAESTKTNRSDKWSEIIQLDMGLQVGVDPKSGRAKAAPALDALTITKPIGVASPQLHQAAFSSEYFSEIVIEIVMRPDTGKGEVVFERLTLSNAVISKIHRYSPNQAHEHGPVDYDFVEEISFVTSKVAMENLTGSTAATYDVTASTTS